MGIKELWSVLSPYCERKPLYELQGKVVAIDLAGWICESLCVVDYEVQARNYLRNLFFRTCYLLLSGVTPVFVLEGEAPALKHGTISKRNEIQFRGARPRKEPSSQVAKSQKPAAKKGRSRFNHVLKQCETLLQSMGLQCVQGPSEAEAFCAHLNAAKLVDGVISQDSDCFAYGAIRVYRNFSVSTQGSANASGGAVDVYDMDVIRKTFDIGQNKMIAMALLCGCDYCPEGVGGVGKDAVTKLFNIYSDDEILERLRSWRSNDSKYTSLELKVNDKSICVNCGHHGRSQTHARSGCDLCRTHVGCDESRWKDQRVSIKMELQIRKKCMEIADFPSQEVIDEFKQKPIEMDKLNLHWKQPDLVKFLKMMCRLLQWQEIYCFQKLLPLLTRWQLFHYGSGYQNIPSRGIVSPDFIKKKRAPKGIASYEIIWKDDHKCFQGLIPDDQLQIHLSDVRFKDETEALNFLWSTIEPIDLVEKAYPQLLKTFLESKAKKPKATRKKATDGVVSRKATKRNKKAANSSLNDMSDMQEAIGEVGTLLDSGQKQVPTKKKRNTKKNMPAAVNGLQTLDKFLLKKSKTNIENKQLESPKVKTSSAPMNLSEFDFDLDDESFDTDSIDDDNYDQGNISQVIRDMVSNAPKMGEFAGRKLRFDEVNVYKLYEYGDDRVAALSSKEPNIDDACLDPHNKEEEKENQKPDDIPLECSFLAVGEVTPQKTQKGDDSFDEFDLLVMKKSTKTRTSSYLKCLQTGDSLIPSSTPVLINRFLSKYNLEVTKPNLNSSENADLEEAKQSTFFCNGADQNAALDEFENSIDFKNMPDDINLLDSDEHSEDE